MRAVLRARLTRTRRRTHRAVVLFPTRIVRENMATNISKKRKVRNWTRVQLRVRCVRRDNVDVGGFKPSG